MSHFEIHSVGVTTIYEMPTIAEPTWQGACLTCAEMARRGLVSDEHLPVLLGWLSKVLSQTNSPVLPAQLTHPQAICFDIPKGSHSVGSSVRDAASYVLWSLARAHDPKTLAPHASDLARRLVTVALFDREVHIRRAASAAFQEHVGRTVSTTPHLHRVGAYLEKNRACFLMESMFCARPTSIASEQRGTLS